MGGWEEGLAEPRSLSLGVLLQQLAEVGDRFRVAAFGGALGPQARLGRGELDSQPLLVEVHQRELGSRVALQGGLGVPLGGLLVFQAANSLVSELARGGGRLVGRRRSFWGTRAADLALLRTAPWESRAVPARREAPPGVSSTPAQSTGDFVESGISSPQEHLDLELSSSLGSGLGPRAGRGVAAAEQGHSLRVLTLLSRAS